MSPELIKYSRYMRLVVLIAFGIYLFLQGTGLAYAFAAVCFLMAIFTGILLYRQRKYQGTYGEDR